ncbi:MAG: prephenate dehydratase [Methylococcaceae bacterium]|nr:prephenate dehydratase [Methylococcaceae bacterium]MCI0732635.1 prephenate dehydratase [Methylococcaceae bacterium]
MAPLDPLADLRKKIDSVDDEILKLLNERAKLALEVAKSKRASGEATCFYRPDREASVLRRIDEQNQGPLDNDAVLLIFRELMSACLALEKPLTVAFLGPEGTFTQQAARKHFGHGIETLSLASIDEVFREVESQSAQFGVVPVENSTEGVITHTLDSFLTSSLLICGEVNLRIHHNLLSGETSMSGIREIISHQQSFAQCRRWLDRFLPDVKRTSVNSNAEAARRVESLPHSAAIASELAAKLYHLNIIERNIEDEPDNTTRFLVIGNVCAERTGMDKTSLVVSTGNQAGALHAMLAPFSAHGVSMTKIESRPSRQGMWSYVFFIDIEGHQSDPDVTRALQDLKQKASMLKVLGSYPKALH